MDEVERLLQHPEDLKRLPNMLEEYTQKHQANKVQLSATVASQVDAARSGMELLESAQKTLAKMQQCYDVRPFHAPFIQTHGMQKCCLDLWLSIARAHRTELSATLALQLGFARLVWRCLKMQRRP